MAIDIKDMKLINLCVNPKVEDNKSLYAIDIHIQRVTEDIVVLAF
jgi:hypothetical protein